ncbi:DEKNAAC102178 [Brettanomyces naardenensis]|uniref:Condensin complex subunit 1 n=1 Tax=Brettanomyces naardenensis TaxID=13370 RepID=A0A448YJX2_BRENA|nr:DEKNAAC102178 [Brettanomyces naardenensis]
MIVDFNLSEAVTTFPDEYDNYEFDSNLGDPKTILGEITDVLAVRPSGILDDEVWEPLQDLTHCYRTLPNGVKYQLVYLITNSLATQIERETRSALQEGEVENFDTQKKILQLYGYLLYVLLYNFGKEDADPKNNELKTHIKKTNDLIESCLGTVSMLLSLRLSLLFQTTPEHNMFVGNLFLNPINALLENQYRAKEGNIKMYSFKVICLAVKYHGQASHMHNAIIQHLTYFPHLSPMMAELLQVLTDHYEFPQLTDGILKDVSAKKFNENDTTGPKSISAFLIKLSEMSPLTMMNQMSSISELLDSNSFTLRCAVVECVGNIISTLAKSQEEYDQHKDSAGDYISLLEERLLDANPFVRSRALQGLIKLTQMQVKFVNRRLRWTKLAVRHLEDRSGLVRRNAIKFLSHLIMSHPYSAINDERLEYEAWNGKLELLTEKLKELQPDIFDDEEENDEEENDEEEKEDEGEDENEEPTDGDEEKMDEDKIDEEKIDEDKIDEDKIVEEDEAAASASSDPSHTSAVHRLFLTWQIYKDCTTFIQLLEKSADLCCELLHSKSKIEVIEVMSYFVLLDAYGISNSAKGIKQMLHLVWMKGSNDEGNQVVDKLIECYESLYLNGPPTDTMLQKATRIAKSLVEITYGASMADLASLEKLIGEFYEKQLIGEDVVNVLWNIFRQQSDSRESRRGSIIVLGMLALANYEISLKGLDLILDIGLDPKSDDWILTSFSCIALRRAIPAKAGTTYRMAKEDETVEKLTTILLKYTTDGQWFGMAEEALNSIYAISAHPDDVATNLLREKTRAVFGEQEDESDQVVELSQLLFLIGHIGLKTVIYLEKCEAEFKKKKIVAENKKNKQDNELDMIGGTNEDDFSDAVQAIKEKELLYGEKSLLAQYVPLVKEVVSHQEEYNDSRLQRQAILCMCKMMCISPRFCESNLGLLLSVMENSDDPIVRSNAVLGLGDMAVCFNSIIDTNKNYLYERLQDPDLMVQRTCLMTVTFLILAGQVKVKGQLAQMAKLYVNEDPAIVDMCKLFFTELATKDNAIYNGFMDMYSGLTADDQLPEKDFKEIIKFVVPFIQKDRHKQQLASKLYQRLLKADSEEAWHQAAFVIREVIPRQDTIGASRRDKESAKGKLYNEILETIGKGFENPEQRE